MVFSPFFFLRQVSMSTKALEIVQTVKVDSLIRDH